MEKKSLDIVSMDLRNFISQMDMKDGDVNHVI